MIRTLLDNGLKLKTLVVTADDEWKDPEDVQDPARSVLHEPEKWPAENYFIANIDVARKILSKTASPGKHEIYAEVYRKNFDIQLPADKVSKVLVLDCVENAESAADAIRLASSLSFDAAVFCGRNADVFSLATTSHSRLHNLLLPISRVLKLELALQLVESWECTPVFLYPLPESEIAKSQVGVPHFWRHGATADTHETVDQEELWDKKLAIVASSRVNFEPPAGAICLSVPVAPSPLLATNYISTLSLNHALPIAMTVLLNVAQKRELSQPSGLRPTHVADLLGFRKSRRLTTELGRPRELTKKQIAMKQKKTAKKRFAAEWDRTEEEMFGKSEESQAEESAQRSTGSTQ